MPPDEEQQTRPAAAGEAAQQQSAIQTTEAVRIDLPETGGGETLAGQSESSFGTFQNKLGKYRQRVLRRPIPYDIISILFALLVFAGGVWGYLSKGSSMSLISGTLFAILLAIGTYFEGARKNSYPLLITLLILTLTMAYRFSLTSKFMPAGLLGLLSSLMLARHCYLLYLRGKQQETQE